MRAWSANQGPGIFPLLVLIEGVAVALLLAGILAKTGGVLVYTLDDGYISLAVSESIAAGGYGINDGEFAAPSSSILYPFLLAPAASTVLHPALPLILNVVGAVIALWALARIAELAGVAQSWGEKLLLVALIALCAYFINFYGVAFAGLEHSLHVGVSLLILAGLIEVIERDEAPWWLMAAIVLAPLVRFEGIVASGAALAILLFAGKPRQAICTAAVTAACLGLYFAAMHALDLPLLPASVTLKSSLASQLVGGSSRGMLDALRQRVTELPSPAVTLCVMAGLALIGPLFAWRPTLKDFLVPFFVASVTIGHALAGGFYWFERYDVYALAVGMAGLLYIYRSAWRFVFDVLTHPRQAPRRFIVGLVAYAAVMAVVAKTGERHAWATREVPAAAFNIYEQQAQMSRFVRDFYRGPVAVEDLGYVAWRNPFYVLDIAGLGSEEVRQARLTGRSDWLAELTERHEIGLVMAYPRLIPTSPKDWVPVATLTLGSPRIVPADDTVVFFRTPRGSKQAIDDALHRFKAGLPGRAALEFLNERSDPQ